MCGLTDLVSLCEVDGREIAHLHSKDVAKDVAELEYLLTRYEIIAEGHSIHLLEKAE